MLKHRKADIIEDLIKITTLFGHKNVVLVGGCADMHYLGTVPNDLDIIIDYDSFARILGSESVIEDAGFYLRRKSSILIVHDLIAEKTPKFLEIMYYGKFQRSKVDLFMAPDMSFLEHDNYEYDERFGFIQGLALRTAGLIKTINYTIDPSMPKVERTWLLNKKTNAILKLATYTQKYSI